MEIMGHLPEIDTFLFVRIVAVRLTGRLREHYEDQAHQYNKQQGECLGIVWFRSFLEDELDRSLSWGSKNATQKERSKMTQDERPRTEVPPVSEPLVVGGGLRGW